MEYNHPSEIVKDLTFGKKASTQVLSGVKKLNDAVKSTLGASGKCVIYEDSLGKPVITKDGVTVAESVFLFHPVEHMGATLIKEAARNTVKEAGDGTTTSTILAHKILSEALSEINKEQSIIDRILRFKKENISIRDIKDGLKSGYEKIVSEIDRKSKKVTNKNIVDVATISTNNDIELGQIIGEAYKKVGKKGMVLMEESDSNITYNEFVDGAQFDSGLKFPHFATNDDKTKAEYEDTYVLISNTTIDSMKRIMNVAKFVISKNKPLLIIAEAEQQALMALAANKVQGKLKVNIVDCPGFGPTKKETLEDIAALTGAKLIDDAIGDDIDMIDETFLGHVSKCVTDSKNTVLTIEKIPDGISDRIKSVENRIANEKNDFIKKYLEQRLAILTGSVAIVKVGADGKTELKEKKDRVEDALYATKAAMIEGVVPGGGVALRDAADSVLNKKNIGERILYKACKEPYRTIIHNAGLDPDNYKCAKDDGVDVRTGDIVDMSRSGIIDPVLVTKTALKNAISVASTIISAGCVISNKRDYDHESD